MIIVLWQFTFCKVLMIYRLHFIQQDEEIPDYEKESELEGKILNQLIHQIPTKNIPQTNFRIKRDPKTSSIHGWTVLIFLLLSSFVFLALHETISEFVASLKENWLKNCLLVISSDYVSILLVCMMEILVFICIYNIVYAQNNKRIFRKVSFQGNDIEIFSEQDDSYFDKYLNEVLYLFQNVKADGIVFEDLDRYNAPLVFERLGEINTLVNRKRTEEEKPLRFFYLLRDDVFISKDRAKFFDYIVPIVPVLDSSNSYDQFIKHLKEGDLISKFDNNFLQRLSLYVDDMRILKNIYNEFVIYIHKINTTELDWNKMMSLIVYKNIFPRDFSDLQLGKGYVHEIFAGHEKLVESMLHQLETNKQVLLDDIELAKKEILESTQELDAVYADKETRLPQYQNCLPRRFTDEGIRLKEQNDREKEKRKEVIETGKNKYIAQKESELAALDHEIHVTETKLLKELITRENEKEVFVNVCSVNPIGKAIEYNEIKSNDYFELLKFLVRDGYLDETYNDYMTFFYEDSLSARDKTFLRIITDKRGANYTYELKDAEKVLMSPVLRIVDFEEEETLNFSLLKCLLSKDNGTEIIREYMVTFFRQLRDKKLVDFISKYYDSKQYVEPFVINLNILWSDFFRYVLDGDKMSAVQVRRFSLDTICLSDDEVIEQINKDGCLTEYISGCEDYLNISEPKTNRIISVFTLLGVEFVNIDYSKSNRDLFDGVYNHNLYVLSSENIRLMLHEQYGIRDDEEIKHKNYSMIQSNPESPLAQYVALIMNQYMESVLEECDGIITDDEACVLLILNNEEVTDDNKQNYVDSLITTIQDINEITNAKLWAMALNGNVILFSVENFMSYYEQFGLDENLVGYLNRYNEMVDFSTVKADYGEDTATKLFDSVVLNNTVDNQKYEKILNDLDYEFDSYEKVGLSDEKILILINNSIVSMNINSLVFFRQKYKGHIYTFINRNLEKYLEIMAPDIFVMEEAMQIIEWDILDEQKIALLKNAIGAISVVDKNISDKVMAHILSSNMDMEDCDYLYKNYQSLGDKTKQFIEQLAKEQIASIISQTPNLDYKLMSSLLKNESIAMVVRIQLFTKYIPRLNDEICNNCFDDLGLSDLKGIFTKSNSNKLYDNTSEIVTVLNALKDNERIIDYKESYDDTEKLVVTRYKIKD